MNKYADIKLGYQCNNNCKHCAIANQKLVANKVRGYENRSTEECKQEILDSFNKNCNIVVITGGEPTIRKDFIEIIKYAKSLGLTVCLQTNARRFKDDSFALEASKYLDYSTFAIHGSTAETHDEVTCATGSFEDTIAGIKNMLKYTKNLSCKVVISNYNSNDLLGIVKLLDSIGVPHVNIAFPHAVGNAANMFEEVVPYYSNIRSELEACIKYAQDHSIRLEYEAVLPCVFESDYDLDFFADFKHGYDAAEVKQLDRIETIDWNEARKNIKRKSEECQNCKFNNICEGFWMEYINIRGFKEFFVKR